MASVGTSQSNVTASGTGDNSNFKTALIALMVLFFMMGFITCLNDILVPYLKKVFTLSYTQAALIQFCFFGAYGVMSIPSSKIVQNFGYKRGMVIGFIGAALGCLLFLPAVSMQSYPVFLGALFILASGIVLLQVAANPYVSILGSPETASARLTLNQALNSVGTTIAPVFGAYFILSSLEQEGSQGVKMPYIGIALTLIIIAFVISRLNLPGIKAGDTDREGAAHESEHSSAWSYKHLVFGAIGIFCYVGAEVAIGSYLINYFGMPGVAGLAAADAAHYVAFYWGGAMVGRFIGAYLMQKINPAKLLTFNASASIVLLLISIFSSGHLAMYSIILCGLCNSIMFPTIFTLSVKGLGKHTDQGSGILSTAIVGGAVIPLIQGALADVPSITLRLAFLVPALCYCYIVWFGMRGYKADEQTK